MKGIVVIDEDDCIGCGSCEEICPAIFKLDEDLEKAAVIDPDSDDTECIEEAMGACPSSCIFWEE